MGTGFRLSGSLNRMRQSMELTQRGLAVQARPDLLTNVLLSVGRALAVDYLWIGLQQMQQEGRDFDAMQRAEWICQLQPHFAAVWVFHSWNMAYNISVKRLSKEDRWWWIKNGYELLRDRGIPLNPKSIELYRQLAWIFQHKIGGMSDDHHWYYKITLARAMEEIIGYPDAKYAIMAKAPKTWESLMAVPRMTGFVAALETMRIDPQDFVAVLADRENQGEKVIALLDDPKNAECVDMLEGYLRADRLYRQWKLDSKFIGELRRDDMFGPLDFRTPQAHAIYWAAKGLQESGQKKFTFEALVAPSFDFRANSGEGLKGADDVVAAMIDDDTGLNALNTKRVITGAIQDLFRRGRFIITDYTPLATPDLRFVPVEHRLFLALGRVFAEAEGGEWDGTAGQIFKSGHVNFLRKAISFYYRFDDQANAKKYWNIMTKLYPLKEYNVGMRRYIGKYVLEDVKSKGLADIGGTVYAYLVQAFERYAIGDDYSAAAMKRYARMIYDAYMSEKEHMRPTDRVNLPKWDTMVDQARGDVLRMLKPELADRLRQRLGE